METKANYVLIGVFTVLVILGAFGFVIWLGKVEVDREFSFFRIRFEGAVNGLSLGSDVRYNGIKVGEVSELMLDPDDPSKVLVRIKVAPSTPVTEDSVASVEIQGLTGVAFVQIGGGSPDSMALTAPRGQGPPFIPAERSEIQKIFADVPTLLQTLNEVALRITDLLDEENRRSIAASLRNVEQVTAALSAQNDNIAALIDNATQASTELNTTAQHINSLAFRLEALSTKAEGLMDGEIPALIADARGTAKSIGKLADESQALIAEGRARLANFDGLEQMELFVIEARQLIATLERVAYRLERDPTGFIFGNAAEEYEIK